MPKLAADKDHVEAAGDQVARERVPQAVEGQVARRLYSGGRDGFAERLADPSVVEAAPPVVVTKTKSEGAL